MILAIDPGPEKSAYVFLGRHLEPKSFDICSNKELLEIISKIYQYPNVAIEMVASYGMPVGKEVFETCVWIGRFKQALISNSVKRMVNIYRMEEKMTLCRDSRAKDGNIRQALIDRFGVVGTKKQPGWFYGVSKDVWAAIAVGVTYADLYLTKEG
jgi:hypothetical protein